MSTQSIDRISHYRAGSFGKLSMFSSVHVGAERPAGLKEISKPDRLLPDDNRGHQSPAKRASRMRLVSA